MHNQVRPLALPSKKRRGKVIVCRNGQVIFGRSQPMARKKLSRNAPCPCGSGKKYKACCWDKGFEWVEDEAGTVYRSTPMSPEVREALEQLRQAFVARHGREPGPDDLLFPDMPHPEHLEAMMVEDMKAAGLDPA